MFFAHEGCSLTFLPGNRLAKVQNFAACILIIVCMLLAVQALALPAHCSTLHLPAGA